jgi:hypothetical protein
MDTIKFHSDINNEEWPQAVRLAEYITRTFPEVKQVLDFGCSSGLYLKALNSQRPDLSLSGFDNSAEAVRMAEAAYIHQQDLTQSIPSHLVQKDVPTLGICLEVFEHIPHNDIRAVMDNLTEHSDIIIFSAAIPGQGGTGHINCRPRMDWIRWFESFGWLVDLDATEHLVSHMRNGYHMGWFVQNAMVLVPVRRREVHTIKTFVKHY